MDKSYSTQIAGVLWLCTFLLLAGCEPSFDPLQENNKYHFSIYGYLDATADTQWVRVMPVWDSISTNVRPIQARVVLENIDTGESAVMEDSLFRYPQGEYAHNFWTAMELEPEATYRLTAGDPDADAMSSVTVTLPPDFPPPYVILNDGGRTQEFDHIYVEGVEQLADVQTVYINRTTSGITINAFPHLRDTTVTTSNEYLIQIDPASDQENMGKTAAKKENAKYKPPPGEYIFIAAASPQYPYFPGIDPNIRALPDGISNVENGVGYLTGIVSKTIPYDECFEDDGITFKPCGTVAYPW